MCLVPKLKKFLFLVAFTLFVSNISVYVRGGGHDEHSMTVRLVAIVLTVAGVMLVFLDWEDH